jgi:hypothetical protein
LSRLACRHVKQGAKRPGTRVPGQDFFLGRFFVGFAQDPDFGKIMRQA